MQDSIQTAPAPVTPQASIPSSVPAPTQAYQSAPAQSAQPSYQIPSAPQVAPEAPQAPAAPQANPWQEAFNRLSDSLSATRTSNPRQPTQRRPHRWPSERGLRLRRRTKRLLPYRGSRPQFPKQRRRTPDTGAELQQRADRSRERRVSASVSAESLEVLQHFGAERQRS